MALDKLTTNSDILKLIKFQAELEKLNNSDENSSLFDELNKFKENNDAQKLIENGFYKYIPVKNAKGEIKYWKNEPEYYKLAEYIIEKFSLMTDDSYRLMYQNNCYSHVSKNQLLNLICDYTLDKAKPGEVDNFFKIIIAKAFKARIDIEEPYRKINLRNGVYDLEKNELLPHSKDHFFRYCLDHEYKEGATCPNFEKYLNFVLEDRDLIRLTAQMFGYVLMGGDPIAHRAFLLYGDGRNGKSTLLDTMRYLIGEVNSASVSMKFLDKPFSTVQMDGKLANIVEESPTTIDAEAFKNIVGGGRVTASYKGKDEFQMKINARLIFACNSLPTFKDATSGINDRLIIIPFDRYIKPEERDTSIKDKIFSEISGVLNWAIRGYNDLKQNNFKFIETEKTKKALIEYREETDSTYAWCKENIEKTDMVEAYVSCKIAYDAYVYDTRADGLNPMGKRKFLTRMRSFMLSEFNLRAETGLKRIKGDVSRVFFKIICKSDKYIEMDRNQYF